MSMVLTARGLRDPMPAIAGTASPRCPSFSDHPRPCWSGRKTPPALIPPRWLITESMRSNLDSRVREGTVFDSSVYAWHSPPDGFNKRVVFEGFEQSQRGRRCAVQRQCQHG